ncbi:hypothetical protein DICPUDRAFT_96485 [Dictyostelium purpureum]|uniref:Uncharacterized protein n=1 Tax=Dictyostelium purpureum TaxID=5786 RepID=F0Z8Q8_DICPU|nr:uncharacterized protein DICPUDRAFT_96485 [Dictyostelium purpureum]EGC39702.1 hypothetical protein DICPUDRAFT_96485 [Dictyostelium purpureum]|eukprot:XP_003283811.1 hypothetical protein DICPUDRAFT_96485 [Dictyostelium purpureum]
MLILPNYICEYILETILYYYYKKDLIFYLDQYLISNNNEIIQYSLVSKTWFQCVSNILPKLNKCYNCNVFKGLSVQNPSQVTQKFKLIKIQDSIKVFSRLSQFQDLTSEEFNSKDYKKIYINETLFADQATRLLDSIEKYPENCNFGTIILSPLDLIKLSKNKTTEKKKGVSFQKIKNITLSGNKDALLDILELDLKSIEFYETMSHSLELKFKQNQSSKKLSIDDLVFPQYMDADQSFSKLKKFSYLTTVDKVIDINFKYQDENDEMEFEEEFQDDDQDENDGMEAEDEVQDGTSNIVKSWQYYVDRLSNDPNFTSFSIAHQCDRGCNCRFKINNDLIVDGYKSILSNPKSNLKVFKCYGGKLSTNIQLFEALKVNKSIVDVHISSAYFETIIETILSTNVNRTIRNLTVTTREVQDRLCTHGLKLLCDKKIDLHSITIIIKKSNFNPNFYLDFIKSSSLKFNINEINIINDIGLDIGKIKTVFYQKISNNTIINILTHKKGNK